MCVYVCVTVITLVHVFTLLKCCIFLQENSANTAKRQADLHRACILGQLQVAQSLLTQGANANGVASNGTLPLHEAIKGDNLEVVRLLLSYGANPYQSDSAGKVALQMVHSREMKILVKGESNVMFISPLVKGRPSSISIEFPFTSFYFVNPSNLRHIIIDVFLFS